MKPEEFKRLWSAYENNLCPLSKSKLLRLNLKPATADFLTIAGLPDSAPPFLSFGHTTVGNYSKLTEFYDFLEPEYDKYFSIGSCSDGDVIAINIDNDDKIEWLDHEDYFSSQFFNSTINNLAECLVIYKDFVQKIQKENGDNAYMKANFNDSQFENLKQQLSIADSKAITEDGFWKSELDTLLANRSYFRK